MRALSFLFVATQEGCGTCTAFRCGLSQLQQLGDDPYRDALYGLGACIPICTFQCIAQCTSRMCNLANAWIYSSSFCQLIVAIWAYFKPDLLALCPFFPHLFWSDENKLWLIDWVERGLANLSIKLHRAAIDDSKHAALPPLLVDSDRAERAH